MDRSEEKSENGGEAEPGTGAQPDDHQGGEGHGPARSSAALDVPHVGSQVQEGNDVGDLHKEKVPGDGSSELVTETAGGNVIRIDVAVLGVNALRDGEEDFLFPAFVDGVDFGAVDDFHAAFQEVGDGEGLGRGELSRGVEGGFPHDSLETVLAPVVVQRGQVVRVIFQRVEVVVPLLENTADQTEADARKLGSAASTRLHAKIGKFVFLAVDCGNLGLDFVVHFQCLGRENPWSARCHFRKQ